LVIQCAVEDRIVKRYDRRMHAENVLSCGCGPERSGASV
jgi:hypothetical protein